MKRKKPMIWILFFFTFSGLSLEAQETDNNSMERKNELSLFIGATSNESTTAFTYGLDYQYRLSELFGIGVILDHAAGDIESTLLGPALFLHWAQVELALVPAIEFVDSETNYIFRLGFEYEFEFDDKYSLAPSVNFDLERRNEFAVVYGLSFAFKF